MGNSISVSKGKTKNNKKTNNKNTKGNNSNNSRNRNSNNSRNRNSNNSRNRNSNNSRSSNNRRMNRKIHTIETRCIFQDGTKNCITIKRHSGKNSNNTNDLLLNNLNNQMFDVFINNTSGKKIRL